MTVLSSTLHWTGATGERGKDGKRKYAAMYRVRTNDPLDQPETIIAYFEANGPYIGDAYSYANDSDAAAFCESIAPRREEGHPTLWEVVFSYAEADEDDRDKDENGDPTEDPLLFYDDVSIQFAQFTKPVELATLRTALPQRQVGLIELPANSAGVPFDPPLERDHSRTAVRITKNKTSYNDAFYEQYQDTVNQAVINVNKQFVKFTAKWDPFQAKMQNTSGAFRIKNGVKYWEVTHEIQIDREGWRVKVVDRGFHARAQIGDPDGRGGMVGFGPDGTALPGQHPPNGVPPIRRLLDLNGEPVANPVLLDGQGQPLKAGQPPFLITYSIYEEKAWGLLNL